MPRVPLSSRRVQVLLQERLLRELVLAGGSVRELASRLNSAISGVPGIGVIHPNRLHALLSDVPSQTLNDATLVAIETAVERMAGRDAEDFATAFADLRRKLEGAWWADRSSSIGIADVAAAVGVAPALARFVLEAAGSASPAISTKPAPSVVAKSRIPDWSFQDEAVARCKAALMASMTAKVGAVLPTGAGKTRVGLRIGLQLLAEDTAGTSRLLWVTHRKHLRRQAHRELQRMLAAGVTGLPPDAASLLADRVDFVMVSDLLPLLTAPPSPLAGVIIDEGHHAAAAGYRSVFETNYPLRVLCLTATPNRTDGLPIGIERIAYSITYRELADRGVILIPEFLDFPVEDFEWGAEEVDQLAEEVIERARGPFTKTLVLAPRIARVEEFYGALLKALASAGGHPLDADDIGYIHSDRTSLDIDSEAFLSLFATKPRGIIVSAQMLLEGFDDPAINAVVVTYPSQSLIVLMQAAGRCVRSAPGKSTAFVMQATNPGLAYRFDQRWLYEEISDYLKPELVDVEFSAINGRDTLVQALLAKHHVPAAYSEAALLAIKDCPIDESLQILLFGLPYFGDKARFTTDACWGVLVETPARRGLLRSLFNRHCAMGADCTEPASLVSEVATQVNVALTDFESRQYAELITAMRFAKHEVVDGNMFTPLQAARPFMPHHATTWLKYVSFHPRFAAQQAVLAFLADCYNRDAIVAALAHQEPGGLIVKIPVPLGGYEAHTLNSNASTELTDLVGALRTTLSGSEPEARFKVLGGEIAGIGTSLLPRRLIDRIEHLLTTEGWSFATLTV